MTELASVVHEVNLRRPNSIGIEDAELAGSACVMVEDDRWQCDHVARESNVS